MSQAEYGLTNNPAEKLLQETIANTSSEDLGRPHKRTDIPTTEPHFWMFPERRIIYPEIVQQGLINIYAEYNQVFTAATLRNREQDTNYQYCLTGPNGTAVNYFVQIDSVGLPIEFLERADEFTPQQVEDALRKTIFEVENSLARYNLMEGLFAYGGQPSIFSENFRAVQEMLRDRFQMPIALLATTDAKFNHMADSEFGVKNGGLVSDARAKRLSGFDRFFSPAEFAEHARATNGDIGYLLYVRSSEPVAKLRKPNIQVDNPLLGDDNLRMVIKDHSITMNVDNPSWGPHDPRVINDTKFYLEEMGMGINVYSDTELADVISSSEFADYMMSRGYTAEEIENGVARIVAKPMNASYGGYGHQKAEISNTKLMADIRRDIRKRGPYVLQAEMSSPLVTNTHNGQTFEFISRYFIGTPDGVNFYPIGGFASHMPTDTFEYERGRNHGNENTHWMELV